MDSDGRPAAQPLLVGRQAELDRLAYLWDLAQQGTCRLVLVSGAAGVGKTALVGAFAHQVAAQARKSTPAHTAGQPSPPTSSATI